MPGSQRSAEQQPTGTSYHSQSEKGMPNRDKEAHRQALENSGRKEASPIRTIAFRRDRNKKPAHLRSSALYYTRCFSAQPSSRRRCRISTKACRHFPRAIIRRDPQMQSSKKGYQWYFGMKAHVGVDASSGLVHTAVAPRQQAGTDRLDRAGTRAQL